MVHNSIVRAAVVVALGAVLDAVVSPTLTLGSISPKFTIIAIVFAASGLRDLQAVLLGFFGGILIDALGVGLFGVGALGGLVAGTLAARAGGVRRKGPERLLLAQVVAVSVAAYALIRLIAVNLAGLEGPALGGFLVSGLIPDALLNAVLAYLLGRWLLKILRAKDNR